MEFIDLELWSYVLGMVVLVSLFSGFYPSFVVSSFSPILALKNKMGNQGSSGFNLRRSLVILQFGISQLLVIATLVIIVQMNYFRGKDLGFRKDAVITVPIPRMVSSADSSRSTRMKTLRNELMRLGGVERASLNNSPPSSGSVSGTGFTMEGEDTFYDTQVKTIDGNYLDLFELPLVAGTNLLDLDTAQGFLVNERLASLAGFASPQDIVGKRIKMWRKTLPVVGVLKNFHTVSLHRPIEPTILLNRISNYGSMSIRINPMDMQGTIREIEKKWVATYPELVFSYEFLDQSIREFYETEERTAVLLSVFTSLAILIGCLGLFGLASFMANQKMKEIGIRKVLGATVESILLLFSREFGLLILLGFVLATPIAWFGMSRYLNDFAYKIELGPGIFLSGLGMTLFVAAITVGYRSIRTATVNPVDSLRSE